MASAHRRKSTAQHVLRSVEHYLDGADAVADLWFSQGKEAQPGARTILGAVESDLGPDLNRRVAPLV